MKKLFAILLAALTLTGCSKSGGSFSGSGTVHNENSSITENGEYSSSSGNETSFGSEIEKAAGGISSEKVTSGADSINDNNANSVTRLTDSNRSEEYLFSVNSITGETVDINNSDIIFELWDFIWDIEHSVKPYTPSEEPDFLPTDVLIMKSPVDDKEYALRTGYLPETYTENTFLIIEGIENGDTDYVCYEDFRGVFELMLYGLAERASKGESFDSIKDKITITNFEDCTFTGKSEVFDFETRTNTLYSGTLTEDAARKIWELLTEIENTEPIVFDDNDTVGSYGSKIVIRNEHTGKTRAVYPDAILYDNPMECGGSCVMVLGDNTYSSFDIGGGVYAHDRLLELINEGIAREENIVWQETDDPEPAPTISKIALVYQYVNYAWGYQNNGMIVDLDGYIYKFDLSDIEPVAGEDFVKVLEYRYLNGKLGDPAEKLEDVDKIRQIPAIADAISYDAKIKEKHQAYDAGQRTLYALNSDRELIEIRSDGDYKRTNTDKNAKRIAKIWAGIMMSY